MKRVAAILLGLAVLAGTAQAQGCRSDPKKGCPIVIKPGQVAKMTWKPAPPHPDVAMCCGGALQLSWSQMDSGVVASVVLNADDSCPSSLRNQQFVKYLYEAQPKGLVTLDFKQNGDYYISSSVAEHCSEQGMQFLLAVRGCPQDNPTYTPVVPLNLQCSQQQQQGLSINNATASMSGFGSGGLAGFGTGDQATGNERRRGRANAAHGAAASSVVAALAAVAAGMAGALL